MKRIVMAVIVIIVGISCLSIYAYADVPDVDVELEYSIVSKDTLAARFSWQTLDQDFLKSNKATPYDAFLQIRVFMVNNSAERVVTTGRNQYVLGFVSCPSDSFDTGRIGGVNRMVADIGKGRNYITTIYTGIRGINRASGGDANLWFNREFYITFKWYVESVGTWQQDIFLKIPTQQLIGKYNSLRWQPNGTWIKGDVQNLDIQPYYVK